MHSSKRDNRGAVFLVGYMGCGKSRVAPLLAERLGLGVYSLDDEVEREAGMSIAEIFRTRGEAAFRRKELEILRLLPRGGVHALGGGAFMNPEVRHHIRSAGWSVYLEWPFATLYDRIANDSSRPLVDHWAGLRRRYLQRRPVYRSADLCWSSAPPFMESPARVAEGIHAMLRATCWDRIAGAKG